MTLQTVQKNEACIFNLTLENFQNPSTIEEAIDSHNQLIIPNIEVACNVLSHHYPTSGHFLDTFENSMVTAENVSPQNGTGQAAVEPGENMQLPSHHKVIQGQKFSGRNSSSQQQNSAKINELENAINVLDNCSNCNQSLLLCTCTDEMMCNRCTMIRSNCGCNRKCLDCNLIIFNTPVEIIHQNIKCICRTWTWNTDYPWNN